MIKVIVKGRVNATYIEGVYTLLNSYHMRMANVQVNDIDYNLGGRQNLIVQDIIFPLEFNHIQGKIYFYHESKPTSDVHRTSVVLSNLYDIKDSYVKLKKLELKEFRDILSGLTLEAAEKTASCTTCFYPDTNFNNVIHPRDHIKEHLTKLSVRHVQGIVSMYYIHVKKDITSIRGFHSAEIYQHTTSRFLVSYLQKQEKGNEVTLNDYFKTYGALKRLKVDNAKSEKRKKQKKILRKYSTKL